MTGYHHVEHVMGTAITIDVHDELHGRPGLREALDWLHHVDRTFSPYVDDSPISRLGSGSLLFTDATSEVRDVLVRCEELRAATKGAFDAFTVPAPNGTNLDPSGFVKGWSIDRAAGILEAHGAHNFAINAGGDVVLRGAPLPDAAWRVGIRDPHERDGVVAVLVGPTAVATSGSYERGAHIIDPATRAPTADIASATVAGHDLGTADAYATALFVMGPAGLSWLAGQPGYEGLIITHDHQLLTTSGMCSWLR